MGEIISGGKAVGLPGNRHTESVTKGHFGIFNFRRVMFFPRGQALLIGVRDQLAGVRLWTNVDTPKKGISREPSKMVPPE